MIEIINEIPFYKANNKEQNAVQGFLKQKDKIKENNIEKLKNGINKITFDGFMIYATDSDVKIIKRKKGGER